MPPGVVVGVAGGCWEGREGSRPRRARWVGVRGRSVRVSEGFRRGREAVSMLKRRRRLRRRVRRW